MSTCTADPHLLERYVKKILAAPVYDLAVRTPLQAAPGLSALLGNTVLLKREDLQPTFSFKIRGGYNKLVQLGEAEKARGVVTASAGNHAHGFAICRDWVDDVITVSNDQLCTAIKLIYDDTRSITEPSGALAVAGIGSYVARHGVRKQTLVAVNSGANINFDSLRHVAERVTASAGLNV